MILADDVASAIELLAEVLDRSDDAETRRKDDLDCVRRQRIAAETRLRRLLELVEEGLMSPRDGIFGEKLAEGRASIAALSTTEKRLETQLGVRGHAIDDATVEKFGQMLRAQQRMAICAAATSGCSSAPYR